MPSSHVNQILDELQSIKKLLLVGLQQSGYSQVALATRLGLNQSTISRLLNGKTPVVPARNGRPRSRLRDRGK